MKFKDILKISCFFIGLFILLQLVSLVLIPTKNVLKYGFYESAKNDILQEKRDTIDVIALGDSVIYSSISPMEIWNDYGYTSFDVSEAAQIMVDAKEYLEVAYDSQHPKMVLMEGSILLRDPSKSPRQQKEKRMKRDLKSILPVIRFHANWKNLSISNGYDLLNITKGYVFISKTVPPTNEKDYMAKTSKNVKIPDGNEDYFKEIVDFCNDRSIKLVLVVMPAKIGWNYKKHNTIYSISKKYNIEFIDFNIGNPAKIDWKSDTKDKGKHLNYKGAKKVSKYIGEYLKKTGIFVSHKDDNKYKSWNTSYDLYKKYIKKELIRSEYKK